MLQILEGLQRGRGGQPERLSFPLICPEHSSWNPATDRTSLSTLPRVRFDHKRTRHVGRIQRTRGKVGRRRRKGINVSILIRFGILLTLIGSYFSKPWPNCRTWAC